MTVLDGCPPALTDRVCRLLTYEIQDSYKAKVEVRLRAARRLGTMVAAGSDDPSPGPELTAGTSTEPVVRPRTKKPKHVKRTIADLASILESSSLDEQNPMNDPAISNSPVSVDQSSVDVRRKQKRSKVDKSQMRIRTKPDRSRVSLQDEPAAPMESELTP